MSANKCPHRNVQQFTELCLDCGRNTYETDEEYVSYLREEAKRLLQQVNKNALEKEAAELEAKIAAMRAVLGR